MQLGRAFIHGLSGDAQGILDVVRVSIGLARRAKEPAELTIDIADIRRIEMTIDVKVSGPPMFPAPHVVGKFTQRVEIVGGKKGDAIFEGEAFAGFDWDDANRSKCQKHGVRSQKSKQFFKAGSVLHLIQSIPLPKIDSLQLAEPEPAGRSSWLSRFE